MVDSSRPVLYINVFIKDASTAIKDKVEKKVAEKMANRRLLPEKMKDRLAKRAGKIASDMVTATKIVEKMAPKMCLDMPTKMKAKGLTVEVEEAFREGPFFVLQMQVVHVDTVIMAEASALRDAEDKDAVSVQCLKQFFGVIGSKHQDSLETKYLPRIIQSKMHSSMGEKLTEELAEKGMEAEAEVLPEAQQARFFFPMLQQIRELESKPRKGPLVNLGKKK